MWTDPHHSGEMNMINVVSSLARDFPFKTGAFYLCSCCVRVRVTQGEGLFKHTFRCFSSFLLGVKFVWVFRVTSGIPTTAITDTAPTHAPNKLDNYIPDCSLLIA